MGHYIPSRKYRYAIAEKVEQGLTLKEAEDEVFKGNSNKAKYLKYYKREGLFPYGKIDPPFKTRQSSTIVSAIKQGVSQETVVDSKDSFRVDKAEKFIDTTLEARVKALEDILKCSSSRLQLRPKLKRTTKNCIPTSFRLPRELVRRAREKAKTDPVGAAGLNAVVELFLFRYIDSPSDLLE